MLCESKQRIGFIGACFFIGVLCASIIVPVGLLSDIYGRKNPFLLSVMVEIIACVGFIFSKSMEELYLYMFLFGCSFPGRIIVGFTYAYEYLLEK